MFIVLIPSILLVWLIHITLFSAYSYKGIWVPISPTRLLASICIPVVMALYGHKKKSLNKSGILSSLFVGFILTISNYCHISSMLIFFVVCSKLTKFGSKKKIHLEENYKEGGQRNWIQVICNAGIPCELAILALIEAGSVELVIDFQKYKTISLLNIAFLSSVACCCGDTFASEIGTIIGGEPRLITTLRKVPKGTNGAVSICGLIVSGLGGLMIGATYYVTLYLSTSSLTWQHSNHQIDLLWIGMWSGIIGSVIDSYLGATVQYSGYDSNNRKIVEKPGTNIKHISGRNILDNHSVNLVSSLFTAIIVPFIAKKYYFQV